MHESIVFCSIRVRCRRTESSRSLSHLLMSFLYLIGISSSRGDKQDSLSRRNAFIGEVNSVLCYFGNPKVTQNTINLNYESIYYACSDYPAYWELPSSVKARLFASYCTSFYGCVLWDLSCSALYDFFSGGMECQRPLGL